ncbi:MAG: hypothetical protein HYY10_02415 [Candidatus Liptonbacteria bacterium]|nr:hypothetical protein [Candidatus Liptonbacteria bacterium]
MERVHQFKLSRGLSDEEDENDGLASFDDELEETTLPSEEGLEREEEGGGQRQEDRFGLNE